MSVMTDPKVLSRSGIFHRLGNLLSDVSSTHSSDSYIPLFPEQPTVQQADLVRFDTNFAQLSYRQDLASIEYVHIRCRPASSFDASIHTSLCEAVLGIYPDTTTASTERPVLVRGVVERRHRRIKVGDWLLAINGHRLNWSNLDDILSKYHANRKVRLTIRHPHNYHSTFSSSLQPPITFPTIEEKKIILPETIDCIHSVLYYEKRVNQGFKLLYQQPMQKDLFFAAGGVFPTLTQLMHDMNEHNNILRSITIQLAQQTIPVCVVSDDQIHYLIIIYPPIESLHIHLLERYTQHLIHLINFLFVSLDRGLNFHRESIEYFFDIMFYRLNHLLPTSKTASSSVLKNLRLIDEFLPGQFDEYGVCPKFFVDNPQLLVNIDGLLNQFECQNFNECSDEKDSLSNRYRRNFFIQGSILFHRRYLFLSHLSTRLTNDIYHFLLHYGHLNMSQFYSDAWQLLLFKEIFPLGDSDKQRSFVVVCSQGELTLAIVIENPYEKNNFRISPDHSLIQQMKLVLNDIYSITPKMLSHSSPWPLSLPTAFLRKQLKRTISLPLIGAFGQSNTKESPVDDAASLTSSYYPDQSMTDARVTQLVSQPESQDELYKSSRQSLISSTLSLDEQHQSNRTLSKAFSAYRLHPGNYCTIFYYLDFQPTRCLLLAPYFTLDRLTQTTVIDRLLFETIEQTCIYIRRKHFSSKKDQSKALFSTKLRPRYTEIACQFSIQTDPDHKKKKDANLFHFWIVGKKCYQPIEHEFFVCYHDSIAQNISELAFTIGMSIA